MRKVLLFLCVLVSGFSVFGQTETINKQKLNVNSSSGYSLFQNQLTDWVWAAGMVGADRWSVFEDGTSAKERLTILPGGNIGIGTTSPATKLHINGSIRGNASGGALRVQTTGGYLDLGSQNSSWAHIYTDRPKIIFNRDVYTVSNAFSSYNNDLILKTKGAERLRIKDENGYVGIGTTNPIAKLQVNGDFFLNSSESVNGWGVTHFNWKGHSLVMGSQKGRYAHNKIELKPGGASNGELLSIISLYQALDEDNHEERIRISTHNSHATWFNGGNVGIGTTTPDAKLAVNGNIHTKEVKVDLVGWADYVFKEDYNLPTLQQVENHISEKGHLINIPSAAEVAENGIQLGEMNAKLLEKIEELTLYTIAQEKKLQEQQKKLIKQEDEISVLKSQSSRINKLEEKLNTLIKTK